MKFTGNPKGQSIAITLGTMATCRWPVMVDLTDGAVHHLMCLKANRLVVWEGLSPTEAYNKIATEVISDGRLLDLETTLDKIDENNQEEDGDLRAAKRLRSSIQCTSLLREQLDSVIPFLRGEEKFWAAHDIISAHVLASSDEMNKGGANDSYVSMFT